MNKMKIGICSYARNEDNEYHLPAEYIEEIIKADALPYILPPAVKDIAAWLAPLDIIILSGGGDINPKLYGEEPHEMIYALDDERDTTELLLVEHLLATKAPTLAICRGMQLINVALGGSLYQHVPDHFGDKVLHRKPQRKPTTHKIQIKPNTRLSEIVYEAEFQATSWHHQAIKELAKPLKAVAFAEDGVIEAVEHEAQPNLIAVQWHPEFNGCGFSCEFLLRQLMSSITK